MLLIYTDGCDQRYQNFLRVENAFIVTHFCALQKKGTIFSDNNYTQAT